jgi:hypothetical protein
MAAGKQLSDGNPDGTSLGQSATDLVGFHGSNPSDQRGTTAALVTCVPTTATSGYGFKTSTQFNALTSAVNEIIALLKEKGLMASA